MLLNNTYEWIHVVYNVRTFEWWNWGGPSTFNKEVHFEIVCISRMAGKLFGFLALALRIYITFTLWKSVLWDIRIEGDIVSFTSFFQSRSNHVMMFNILIASYSWLLEFILSTSPLTTDLLPGSYRVELISFITLSILKGHAETYSPSCVVLDEILGWLGESANMSQILWLTST